MKIFQLISFGIATNAAAITQHIRNAQAGWASLSNDTTTTSAASIVTASAVPSVEYPSSNAIMSTAITSWTPDLTSAVPSPTATVPGPDILANNLKDTEPDAFEAPAAIASACVRGRMKCVDGIVRPCMKRYGSCYDECDGPNPAYPTPVC